MQVPTIFRRIAVGSGKRMPLAIKRNPLYIKMLTLFNANRNSRKAAASAALCGVRFKTPSTVKYCLFCTHKIKIASQAAARITLYTCLQNAFLFPSCFDIKCPLFPLRKWPQLNVQTAAIFQYAIPAEA